MEINSFSPGRPRHETKQQKKERLRKEKARKLREEQRKARKRQGIHTVPKRPSWLLLPSYACEGFDFWILTLKGDSYWSKQADVLSQIQQVKAPRKPFFGFPEGPSEVRIRDFITKANKVITLLYRNQVLRWKFKNFFNKVRCSRFIAVNPTDPITLESFKQPIRLPSFSQRKVYTFEAESFIKHCHKKLLSNDGQIPIPQIPKNPLTNEEFTVTQLMGLFRQCRQLGQTSWVIEAFVSCKYDLSTFLLLHSKPLKLHALRTTMASVSCWEAIDVLYDFIKSEHAHHKKPFTPTTYHWAVEKIPNHSKIQAWRKLCLKWYETEILIDDYDSRERLFQIISEKTDSLCGLPHELQVIRKLFLKSQEQSETETDGSSSSRDTESEG